MDAPPATWTRDDFHNACEKIKSNGKGVVGYDWVVRLWGSWTSWMYANAANLLTEGKADGGDWLWNTFYSGDSGGPAGARGGWSWGAAHSQFSRQRSRRSTT